MSSSSPNWLPSVPLTPSGRPIFLPNEIERCLIPSVDLDPDEDPNLSPLRSGLLILTSHRLLWIQESNSTAFSIPLSSVVHAFPPKKSIRSMFHSPRLRVQLNDRVVTVVMRGKNDPDVFYARLLEAVRAKAWEKDDVAQAATASTSTAGELRVKMPVVGVSGILRKEQEQWENTDKSLQDAFQDLNALMSKAKEMVQLAEKMRLKLLSGSTSQGNQNEEEMGSKQEMQDWLLSVGIMSPVTKETAGALYHQQLSRQLADFVKIPLDKAGGMIALIDIYCLFNRARGTELISPEDLLQACALWEKFDVPVLLRKFESGVMVIQNKSHRDDEVFTRIESLARRPDALRVGISASDAALTLGIAPALAKEQLLTAENKGILCRDVSPEGLRFYINLFKEMNPTDIYLNPTSGHFHAWISCTSLAG